MFGCLLLPEYTFTTTMTMHNKWCYVFVSLNICIDWCVARWVRTNRKYVCATVCLSLKLLVAVNHVVQDIILIPCQNMQHLLTCLLLAFVKLMERCMWYCSWTNRKYVVCMLLVFIDNHVLRTAWDACHPDYDNKINKMKCRWCLLCVYLLHIILLTL